MLNAILAAEKTRTVPIGEAALYALLGFAVVFVGIAFLIFVVWLVGKVMTYTQQREKKVVQTKTETLETPLQNEDELSEETVAVIMAALTAYYQASEAKCEFTVKRIKRI